MGSLSIGHWLIVLLIAVIVCGSGKLRHLGKDVGEGIKNFKDALRGNTDNDNHPPRTGS